MNPVPAYVALTGNPNCGKTTLFNALTGLRAKVGNYAGVTVERKEGRLREAPPEAPVTLLDLPGTYSLSPKSIDEEISRDALFHLLPDVPPLSLVVVVVDASNLERNLYYATQVIELGLPCLVALNMMDVARQNGHEIDVAQLSGFLGVPVIPLVASVNEGLPELRTAIVTRAHQKPPAVAPKRFGQLPAAFAAEVETIAAALHQHATPAPVNRRAEALLLLSDEKLAATGKYPAPVRETVQIARQRVTAAGLDWRSAAIEARYGAVSEIHLTVTNEVQSLQNTFSDRLDQVLTHKVWGTLIFILIMLVMFQSIFTFAHIPMDAMQKAVDWLGSTVGSWLTPGDLRSLLVDGVIAGVGAVVVFLPQILLLFLFIGFLEDTGYMARAAFLMDRLMSKVGLHGKSFIPMLSSYACAIPGIMATRTIETPKDRLVTILVAPLMSCSARLPVYTLLIGACIPNIKVFGVLKLTGLTMLAMYLLGTVMALVMAWVFKKTLLRGETPMLIMELPPYKRPVLRVVARHMWDRSKLFLRRAGTVILGINILLWFLASYPRSSGSEQQLQNQALAAAREAFPDLSDPDTLRQKIAAAQSLPAAPATLSAPGTAAPTLTAPDPLQALNRKLAVLDREQTGAKLRHSFAGMAGRAIAPIIAPLGFDWKMGIGIIGSFAAREVFVSTMSTVYNVETDTDEATSNRALQDTLRQQVRPDGSPVYTPLVAVTLMVFYVFALQCVSTVAVVRRETNTWKWPLFQWLYMGALAWVLAFITYHGGHWLGFH
ncbi:MAG TPA: ferrous iron transport protein B [Dongiaceae bacterium]|nr:ferrous iron transport protein B [Dongiaceae bacterium]